ncbi:hypothetical protein COS55_03270 [Candidatus Shapirobacteria bacterium CG03_land_8_20_14_0_80_40_19]|uniref:Uncharacterized protein n=4 Tax=Candidatus Shapironibacteriota TaxID=1752721 RepID=A0A2M7BBW5_9BACT|nr:MAG: hypothetical protein COV89_01930 [Candidatus Shapirobacteria bacterium CG11_big_fil_rev_8_21_14_0_20_40_12]PIV00595.1 MAG: hypothetical protein COS55_03270 [Candidatus Shapirobacteria bacterium CG03_land_8_20_14_0_80_40_19]PJC29086.1 MAG: hypothetical protein CO053_01180 [Candidatus Shapirobacteria bacterium CG_4_9_14_0_2_um_filter_40_11]PJC76850.1 MAG: hypothetical protein CO010_01575 [Candidatus Shapirobacteria bacterium CG_4_8_14_3_um_filter_39_11]
MSNSILAPKTFLTYSLGCRTNQAEMEDIGLQLTANGLRQTLREPDLVLLNTCVVTAKAEKESRQKIRALRKKHPKSFLVVLGCGVTAREIFNINLPEANLFVSNENKDQTINILNKHLRARLIAPLQSKTCLNNKYIQSGRKFIKIQDGCDKYCSYCLTRYLRGIPKSIPPEKIIKEINFWVKNGIKEVILTGINIGLYPDLTGLLNKILKETKIERISFSSIYPEMLTEDFVKLVINNPRISQYFHLSLQSGSQNVLQRMNRETDLSRLLSIIKQIKAENQLFTFRADIIVGFPNESEEEFRETLDFIKKAKISFAHIFTYSARKGTVAYSLSDLPSQIKKERIKRIVEAVKAIRQKEAEKIIEQTTNCLIVRGNEGMTENGWPIQVRVRDRARVKGKILPVKITDFKNDQLFGEIISLPTN